MLHVLSVFRRNGGLALIAAFEIFNGTFSSFFDSEHNLFKLFCAYRCDTFAHVVFLCILGEVRMHHELRGHPMKEPVDVLAICGLLCSQVHVALLFPYFGMLFFSSYALALAFAFVIATLKAAIAAAEATLASTIGAGYAVPGTVACTFASTYSRTFGSFHA